MPIFITGTGTGIGKTWVSAVLAAKALEENLTCTYYKPIQTGTPTGSPPEDPDFVSRYVPQVPCENRYCYVPPVTPSVADTTGEIDFQVIREDAARYAQLSDVVLIEGAGGLMAPISDTTTMIDLIQTLKLPVLLVAHSQLGTINHTLLSLEALQARNIEVLGLIINAYPQNLDTADIAVQTLLSALTPHLPPNLPVWTCQEGSAPEAAAIDVRFSWQSLLPLCKSV